MSKDIDFSKKLSDEDRAWLHERSQDALVQENDRLFAKKGKDDEEEEPAKAPYTVGAPFYDEGKEPVSEFVQRPYGVDPPITGSFAPKEVEGAEEPEEVLEVGPEELTVEELKDELRARDLPTDGNKAELVKRLKKAL